MTAALEARYEAGKEEVWDELEGVTEVFMPKVCFSIYKCSL